MKVVEGLGAQIKHRSEEEWDQLAHVAKFFADYKDANKYLKAQPNTADMTEFLSRHSESADSADHASIWQKALKKKNDFVKEQKLIKKVDRHGIIRSQLADFNKIQEMSQQRDKLVQQLER